MNNNDFWSAFERFLNKMQTFNDTTVDEACACVTELCEFFNINSIEVELFNGHDSERYSSIESHTIYNSGGFNSHNRVSKRNPTPDERIAVYSAWQKSNSPEWTDLDRRRIELFLGMIFVFNGRSRLMQLAERLSFYDHELNMHNLRYYFFHVNKLCNSDKIIGYTAIYFNLKKFSVVNQQFGRKNGTKIMKQFIHELSKDFFEDEIVCRIGGDNFTMLIRTERLNDTLSILGGTGITAETATGERVLISAYAGILVIDKNTNVSSAPDIMDKTGLAMNIARHSSRDSFVYFDAELKERSRQDNEIAGDFPKAIENEEFLIFYQPKVSLETLELSGAEALCRWERKGKILSPAAFIPVLESGMDICQLDFYMLEHTCMDIRRWLDAGKRVVKISVNLSRRHLYDMDLSNKLLNIIDRYNIPHEYIEFELTETTSDVEFSVLQSTIKTLQLNGISASIDDFGSGYSSLNLIKEIPWNTIKLDKSLLPDSQDDDPMKKNLIKYVIAMAQSIGLTNVAEGVETEEQLELLKDNHCEYVQGYYFDKPMPVFEFEKRLDNYIYTKTE